AGLRPFAVGRRLSQRLRRLRHLLAGFLLGLLCGGPGDDGQDQRLRLDLQGDSWRQPKVAGVHRLADVHALDVDVDALRDVRRLGLHRDLHELLVEHPVARGDLADDPDRHLDGDLLTPPDQDQVHVLDDVPDRIALHGLRQGDLTAVLESLDAQQHVRRLKREHQVVPGQRQVPGLGAVSVQHGGHPALTAAATGSPLTELVTSLGSDLDLGHGAFSSPQRAMRVRSVAENASARGFGRSALLLGEPIYRSRTYNSPGMVSGLISPGIVSGLISPGIVSGSASPGIVSGSASPGIVSGLISPGIVSGSPPSGPASLALISRMSVSSPARARFPMMILSFPWPPEPGHTCEETRSIVSVMSPRICRNGVNLVFLS